MAPDRLDDLDARVRELRATLSGLSAEVGALRSAVDDVDAATPDPASEALEAATVDRGADGASQRAVERAVRRAEGDGDDDRRDERLLVRS
ncbi:MAG: hypothetical protein ABEJ31_07310 [Haloarculaceae archaeon]